MSELRNRMIEDMKLAGVVHSKKPRMDANKREYRKRKGVFGGTSVSVVDWQARLIIVTNQWALCFVHRSTGWS